MNRLQAHKKMNVIFNTADRIGYAVKAANSTTHVSVEIRSPCRRNERSPTFGAKDNVEMKARVRRTHEGSLSFLASLRDAGFWDRYSGGLRPPATICHPFGMEKQDCLNFEDLRRLSTPGYPLSSLRDENAKPSATAFWHRLLKKPLVCWLLFFGITRQFLQFGVDHAKTPCRNQRPSRNVRNNQKRSPVSVSTK